jgi:amino acid transporter/nucleotide-binding universal stress UspA family protein
MMGVGMMIGAGAVIGMGLSIRLAGPGGTLLAFAFDGLVALFTAMSYAEMSSAVPKAGSIYNFARIAFGRSTGFTAGWISWFASSAAGTFYSVICAEYSIDYLAQLGLLDWLKVSNFWQVRLLAIGITLLFVWINYRGVSSTGGSASLLTLGQTAILGFIGLFGLVVFFLHPERLANFKPFLPRGLSGVLICMGVEYIAFEGYEVIAEAGDEAIEPRRNLPKAILYSVLIVTATYVLVAFSLIAGVKNVGLPAWEWLGSFGEKGFGRAMEQLMPMGSLLAVLTVIFAATSALNSTIYSAARASYALGRDRMLPGLLGRISNRRSTPHIAILSSAVITILLLFLPITDIASGASIMFLFLFLLANLAVIRMRWSMEEELQYGFRMPLFPLFPIAAIILQAVLAIFIVNVSWIAWVVAPSWIAMGLAVFLLYSRSHALPIREEIRAVEEVSLLSEAPSAGRQQIVMPIQDLESTLETIHLARRLSQLTHGSIELLHLDSVPDQLPLSDAGMLSLPGQEVMVEAMLYLSALPTLGTSIMYCRNPSRGILWEARQQRAGAILLGWRSASARRGYVFGSTLDPVIRRAPCDVIIARRPGKPPLRNILVPISSGPNTRLASRLAGLLVDPLEGTVRALHVHHPGRRVMDADALVAGVMLKAELPQERYSIGMLTSPYPKRVILEAAQNADLVIIGASLAGWGRRMLRISLPEEIARECDKPMIVVRAGRSRHVL